MAAVCVGALMSQLDASIVTVALPSLEGAFHASVGAVTWVGLSYLVVLVGTVTAVGRFAARCMPAPGAAETNCHAAVSALVAAGKSFEEAAMHQDPCDRRRDRGQDQRTELVAKGDDLALPGVELGL